jgi:hypothetical protein
VGLYAAARGAGARQYGSINQDGKIDALKTATGNLLSQLQNAVTIPGDVYVSIVPFVKDVSVDESAYN